MCGFVVLIQPGKKFSENLLSNIEKSIFHRGPDSGGIYSEKGIALIFRRLSILDLRKIANQPMENKKANVFVVFNGEIYNYKNLKNSLEKKGYNFKTESDTEVILNGYLEWGNKISGKLEGMFAFAIFDKNKKKIFVSRDHMGIKPLYFFSNGEFIYFGSEIRPLKFFNKLTPDKKNLSEIIFFRYAGGKSTGYKNVYKVLPGFNYHVDVDNLYVKKERYFDVRQTFKNQRKSNYQSNIEKLLFRSIDKHTQSDVGFSVQLSGGLDSSLVLAFLHKKYDKKINTYSINIDDIEFNEIQYRKVVNQLYPSEHTEVFCDSSTFADSLEPTIKSLEAPTTHFGCVLLYELCKIISKKNKVVLTGEGSDEIFGGYSRYIEIEKILFLKALSEKLPKFMISKIKKLNFLENYKNKNPYTELITFRSFDILKEVFFELPNSNEFIHNTFQNFENPRNKIALYDQTIYLESLLIRQDKISMAHGLESRVPFVNTSLIKYVNSLSTKDRYDKKMTKKILKQISENFFPREFIYRKKNGLNLPLSKWLLDEKGFGRFLGLFEESNFKLLEYTEKKKISKLVNNFRKKKQIQLGKVISQLINLELWLRSF